jgi:hypothetical protein
MSPMRDLPLADLRRCAGCHDQCQFATAEVFATGSMALDTTRKASLLLALAHGTLDLTDRAVDVIYGALSSGIQHAVCVYRGDRDGWPDEADNLRVARARVVELGRAPAWALAVRDAEATRPPVAVDMPAGRRADLVHLREPISIAADPAGAAQVAAIAHAAGTAPGTITGASGFTLNDLGFVAEAERQAAVLCAALDRFPAATVVTDAPEAAWMIREVWPRWGLRARPRVVHASEWLAELGPPPVAPGSRPGGRVAFHDPSMLARGLGVTDAPRLVLRRLGIEPVEFLRHGEEAPPVGSFHGPAQGAWESRLAADRLASAARSRIDTIVVGSPYDLRSLTAGGTPGMEVVTLHGLVAEAVSGGRGGGL